MTAESRNFTAGTIVRHFKGTEYRIIGFATHTETGERLVIYSPIHAPSLVYARPETMFFSKVDREKYPDVEQEYRFEEVQDDKH